MANEIPQDFLQSSAETTTPSVSGDGVDVKAWMDQYGRLVFAPRDTIITITPTLDTNAYADEDILFEETELANAVFQGGTSTLQSITVIDDDDNGAAFDIYILDQDTDVGNANAAEGLSDAKLDNVLTIVSIVAGDYTDLANGQIAVKSFGDSGTGVKLAPSSSTATSLYAFGIEQEAATYSADGLTIKLGIQRD